MKEIVHIYGLGGKNKEKRLRSPEHGHLKIYIAGETLVFLFSALTPSLWYRPKWVIFLDSHILWVEEPLAVGFPLIGAVLSPLLPLMQVVHHVWVGTLPCCGSCVMIHIIHTTTRVHPSLPAKKHKNIYIY